MDDRPTDRAREGPEVVAITGGRSGIGDAITQRFVSRGATVHVLDIGSAQSALPDTDVVHHQVDVSDPVQVDTAIADIVSGDGGLDVLVNNAGIGLVGDAVIDTSDDVWERSIGVMQSGVFYGMRAAGRHFVERRSGCVVNISSIRGFSANPGRIAYCAAEAAVIMMTKVAAAEWAAYGVRANAIAPGFQMTNMMEAEERRAPGAIGRIADLVPTGRLGNPEEVASLVEFLAGDQAAYINGECITIDGGLTCVPSDADHLQRFPSVQTGEDR